MPISDDIRLFKIAKVCPECGIKSRLVRGAGICLRCNLKHLGRSRKFAYPGEDAVSVDLNYDLDQRQTRVLARFRAIHAESGG